MSKIGLNFLIPIAFAAIASACQGEGPRETSTSALESVRRGDLSNPIARTADGLLAPVEGQSRQICDNAKLRKNPPKFAAIPSMPEPLTGAASRVNRDSEQDRLRKHMDAAASPNSADKNPLAQLSDGHSLRASDLKPADHAYFSEIAQRGAELDQLDPNAREQMKAQIKRRHLGE